MDSCEYCDTQIDYHEVIECITCALDAKDPYTAGHSKRVSDMATKVCELIGLKKEDIQKIHIAAHLHESLWIFFANLITGLSICSSPLSCRLTHSISICCTSLSIV